MNELFEPFPKLARLSQGWTITEKIDGTNSQVLIVSHVNPLALPIDNGRLACVDTQGYFIFAGSRKRIITPEDDNMGFAKWVRHNAEMLIATLGEGRHFGEWWGKGIQRNYGLNEKRFSLFNVHRWNDVELPEGLFVVPHFIHDEYCDDPVMKAREFMDQLKREGSFAAPGFMDPEGVVCFHRASGVGFKKTFEYDEYGKWMEKINAKYQ